MQKKIVMLTAQGFQDEEVIYPYYRMLEEKWQIDVATINGELVKGKYGVPIRKAIDITNINAKEYDAVILPGGFEAPDRVRVIPEAILFVREMHKMNKLIAAICHGPWILITADILRGKKATAYWSIEADMKNAGADYQHKVPLVIDGNIITSPHYDNNGDFMKAVVQYLNQN